MSHRQFAEEFCRVVVKQFKGRGRRAISVVKPPSGSWLFRLYMAWFFNGIDKRRP